MNFRIAEFSEDRNYRFTLWREVQPTLTLEAANGYVQFIGLNPSTADETTDDPTLRRCMGFASAWGFNRMCMTNLFGWRETDSTKLRFVTDPTGRENDYWISLIAKEASMVIAAWGVKGCILGRDGEVKRLIPNLHCLRITKDGHPEHPLYLPKTLRPIPLTT